MEKLLKVILCLAFVQQVHAGDAASAFDNVKAMQSRMAIPKWRASADQISNFHDSMSDNSVLELWGKLDALVDNPIGNAPLHMATNPKNDKEYSAYLAWLRWRILVKNADGRYSYAYAFLLSNMKDDYGSYKEEAVTFLLNARMSMAVDEKRCFDQTSKGVVSVGFESQPAIRNIAGWVESLSAKDSMKVAMEAETIEEMRGERMPMPWLCKAGVLAMNDAIKSGKKFETSKDDSGLIGSRGVVHKIDTSEVSPRMLSNDEWKKERRILLDSVVIGAIEALKKAN